MIRVVLPTHLWRLAGTQREVSLEVAGVPTLTTVLDALEAQYPVLRGTIRDHTSKKRRDFVRFFVCGEDWSHDQTDAPLPEEVLSGKEPVRIIGALAGG
ncbi:MAG: MoaD/ThiS family protein [Anaerolineales bacterium]|jgi:molybdopterin converting factor small subunit